MRSCVHRLTEHVSRFALHALDYIIVLRPTLLFPVWTLVLLGYYHGSSHTSFRVKIGLVPEAIPIHLQLNTRILGTICLYSMLMGATYIINQIADRETDEANNKLYLVARGDVKLPILKLEVGLLFAASIAWAIAWFHDNRGYLILIAVSIILGLIYSVRPLRLKGKPILDLLANALGYGSIAFLVGWGTTAQIGIDALSRTLPYVLCVGAAFINTTLPDLKGDSAYGDCTTGVLLGVRRSCQLSLILIVAATLSAWWVRDAIALITGILCLPFFVYMNFMPKRPVIILTTRIGILILSLITCIVVPPYLILFVCTLLLVRWYYAARFGIKYPFAVKRT